MALIQGTYSVYLLFVFDSCRGYTCQVMNRVT